MRVSKQDMLAAALRDHRSRRGLTQQQLADLSTVSVRAIRDLELGRVRQPRRETLRLIAQALGLDDAEGTALEAAAGVGRPTVVRRVEADVPPPPSALDGLIGRAAEVTVLTELLGSGAQRLITMTGVVGVGKTRVALDVAARLHAAGGLPVLWSSAGDRTRRRLGVPRKLAELVAGAFDARSAAFEPALEELAAWLGAQPALLVIDGYREGRVEPGAIAALLHACHGVRVLVTARVPVELEGERTFSLSPLPVPERAAARDLAALAEVPSMRLLLRHVRRVEPRFALTEQNAAHLAALCELVDGIPGALERIACCFPIYDPAELLADARHDALAFGDPAAGDGRGTSLRAHLRNLVDALAPAERSLLARLVRTERAWSLSDAAQLARMPAATCARVVERLRARGLVFTVRGGRRPEFRALTLLSALPLDASDALGRRHHRGDAVSA